MQHVAPAKVVELFNRAVQLAPEWVILMRDCAQVCEAAGGPCTYTGRDMRTTHDGMEVTAGEFDALVEDLVATLDEFAVPKAEQEELLAILGAMRSTIVEIESDETGTPLPESYEAAPALN